jgi:hypothetical protein
LVDENPYSLKCARGRILVVRAQADDTSHERRELSCGPNRDTLLSARDNRLCNRYSKPFFPYSLITLAIVFSSAVADRSLCTLFPSFESSFAYRVDHPSERENPDPLDRFAAN